MPVKGMSAPHPPPKPSPPVVPEGEMTPLVRSLLAYIEHLQSENAQLRQELQTLRDEVAVLKGLKPRPVFKSSNLDKRSDDDDGPSPRAHDAGALVAIHVTWSGSTQSTSGAFQ